MEGIKMRINKKLLTALFILFAGKIMFAQMNLPEIIQNVTPATAQVLAYNEEDELHSFGSGFFVNTDGQFVTNRHVLEGCCRAEIKTPDGNVFPISCVIAENSEWDLIRVLIDIPSNIALPVSDKLPVVGERIIVIGCPQGFSATVTDGIVSSLRENESFGKIIQISASITNGSSGSPVVNMQGAVIGIATFRKLGEEKLNFAIPGERIVNLVSTKKRTLAEWKVVRQIKWLTSAEGLFTQGQSAIKAEKYHEALSNLQKAVEKNPLYAEAYFQIGFCNNKLGNYPEAMKAYRRALRIKPDYLIVYFNMGTLCNKLKRFKEAVKFFNKIVENKPEYAEAFCNLGTAYLGLGNNQDAIVAFEQAIQIKPNFADAHFNLGIAYSNAELNQKAIRSFKLAILINPNDIQSYYNLGFLYTKMKKYSLAIEVYQEALQLFPKEKGSLTELIMSCTTPVKNNSNFNQKNPLYKFEKRESDRLLSRSQI